MYVGLPHGHMGNTDPCWPMTSPLWCYKSSFFTLLQVLYCITSPLLYYKSSVVLKVFVLYCTTSPVPSYRSLYMLQNTRYTSRYSPTSYLCTKRVRCITSRLLYRKLSTEAYHNTRVLLHTTCSTTHHLLFRSCNKT